MSREMTLDREVPIIRTHDEEEVHDDLTSVIFTPAYERALAATERRRLYAEVMAPLWAGLKDNPASAAAAEKLKEHVMRDVDALRPHDTIRSAGSSWSFDIPPGTSVFTPPYDYAHTGPSEGSDVTLRPDPVAGSISVEVWGAEEYDGALAATAAVGVGLEFRTGGTASVRPYIEYDALLSAAGWLLSSASEGHLGFYVTADDGTGVSTPQDYEIAHVDSDGHFSEASVLRMPYQEVRFLAEAHHRYRVWFWATLTGDQSGGDHFGNSFMGGRIAANVKFVAVEIH